MSHGGWRRFLLLEEISSNAFGKVGRSVHDDSGIGREQRRALGKVPSWRMPCKCSLEARHDVAFATLFRMSKQPNWGSEGQAGQLLLVRELKS
jgi:hypothetical protein